MRKKILSLLAVLFVTATAFATFVIIKNDGTIVPINLDKLPVEQSGNSISISGIDVNEIAHIYNKVWDDDDDYERAFTQGYLSSKYYTIDRKKQITSQEFKAMLKPLVEKYSPDKMDYFNSRVSDEDALIPRYIAAVMAYYVARCIGLLKANSPYHRSEYDNLWEGAWDDIELLNRILPYANVPSADGDNDWIEQINALLWHAEFVSIVSNKEIVAYNVEADSWLWNMPFLREDAVRAITRLYDSFEPEIEYASINDPRVTTPDASIISPWLINKAAQNEIHDIKNLPRQIGFFCGEGNGDLSLPWRFGITPKEIREYAEWGFNSLRYQVSWRHLFDMDLKANLNVFKSLDEIIATAMECGVHISLSMCAMPGCGAYWADNYRDDYVMDNDIMNSEKRKKACDIWKVIATRYKDVPNANLSFQPISEYLGLYNPDDFGKGQSFTLEQIDDYHDIMIDAIREVSPERFIFYTALFMPSKTQSGDMAALGMEQYRHMSEKYTNIRPVCGLMDMAYMFYEYNTGDGNIDWAHHSVWVPTYPTTIYGGNGTVHDDNKLIIDGCLPIGTTINIYIANANNATLNIAADENTLYEETALEGDFNMGFAMAFGEPFRKSDKKVSVTLDSDTEKVVLSAKEGSFNWCGLEVTLPESYTVQKYWKASSWDVELGLISQEEADATWKDGVWQKKATSTIQTGPTTNEWDGGSLYVTVNEDVTFTSSYIFSYSNKELTEQIAKENCESFPKWTCAFEDILVTDMAGALNYWDETMEVYQRYGIDCWISALGLLSEENLAPFRIADYKGENFNSHHNFNVELLRILQKYIDK